MKYRRYVVLLLLLLISFSIALVAIYSEVKKRTIADLNARQIVHARQAAKGIQKHFNHIFDILGNLGRQKAIIQMNAEGRESMADFLRTHTKEVKALTRTDSLGRIVHTVPYNVNVIGEDISHQEHMRTIMRTHQPVISEVFHAVQGYKTIVVHVPVLKNDLYDGTIALLLSFDQLAREYLEDIRIGENGYAWLISRKGIELYCPVPGHVGISVYETCKPFPEIIAMADKMLNGEEGITAYHFDRIRGEKKEKTLKHAVYLPIMIGNTFWSIVVATPEDEVMAILDGFRKRLMLISFLLFIFGSIVAHYFFKTLVIIREQKERNAIEVVLRLNESRLAGLLELSRMSAEAEKTLTDFALDKAIELTGSAIGYLAFTTQDETMLNLHSYSNAAMKECTIKNKPIKCPVVETGLWGEAVRQGRPVITNDYEADNPLKKGYPEGHVRVRRHMNIPLFDGERIVLVAGVGNKVEPYGKDDVEQLTLLMDGLWKILKTKRAEEEKRKLLEQLIQAQRMESIGRLAGGVAHDFNNMLSIIIGRAELALMKLQPSNPLYKDLCEIEAVGKRSADLTRQLLAFARKQTIAPRILNLNDTIESMLKILRRLIGEDIDLLWKPGADLWPVKMDPTQIDQILTNLIVNARDAIKAVGKVIIETANIELDADYCAIHTDFSPGEYVLLTVSDDGTGMDHEMLANIFEPFYTTKGLGQGTGLGLSTIYGIIKQNQGFINVYSEPMHGSTFRIYIPRCCSEKSAETAATGEAAVSAKLPTGTETVLLVEDEPEILELAQLFLKKLGYTLLAASAPGEAIRLAEAYEGEIHLLITDVVMPEMNGRDMAEQLLSHYPHLKCLFMSGYTADVIAHHGVLEEGVHFIQKPFSLHAFAVKLREALGGG